MDDVVRNALTERLTNLQAFVAQFADGETQGEAWFDRQITDLETARTNYHAAVDEVGQIEVLLGEAQ
jgi:hypothetical protein